MSLLVESAARLTKDLRVAARTLTVAEARYLVDAYYTMQDQRIRASNQVRALSASGEPHEVIRWFEDNAGLLERNVRAALAVFAQGQPVGAWAFSQYGVGPVLTAGLLAHIDIERAPTVGHIWRFAGLDPTVEWRPGQKRPWNAQLKVICWKLGESFKKFSGHPECVYGQLYRARKAVEVERNAAGFFADQAAAEAVCDRDFGPCGVHWPSWVAVAVFVESTVAVERVESGESTDENGRVPLSRSEPNTMIVPMTRSEPTLRRVPATRSEPRGGKRPLV